MADERFAWQGFSIPITDEWRPTVLSGSYVRGYARLEGEREDVIQIRWEARRRADALHRRALAYLSALETAAKKRKSRFSGKVEPRDDGSAEFHWHAGQKGYGRVWHDPATGRVLLFERSGSKTGSFKREARALCDAIETYGSGLCPWSVFGLSIRLPVAYRLNTCRLLPGRISLNLRSRFAQLTAERWSLASGLLGKHGFSSWAREATGAPSVVREETGRLELSGRASPLRRVAGWAKTALVVHDSARNHLLVLQAEHRQGHEPRWEWFA